MHFIGQNAFAVNGDINLITALCSHFIPFEKGTPGSNGLT